jgi:hypothetical protein
VDRLKAEILLHDRVLDGEQLGEARPKPWLAWRRGIGEPYSCRRFQRTSLARQYASST